MGGWISIFVAHSGKSHTGEGASTAKQVHVWVGYLVLLLVLLQGVVGISKYVSLPKKMLKWHGKLGPICWVLGCCNVFLGACFWAKPSYTTLVQMVVLMSVLVVVSMTMLLRTLSQASHAKDSSDNGSNEYTPVQYQ